MHSIFFCFEMTPWDWSNVIGRRNYKCDSDWLNWIEICNICLGNVQVWRGCTATFYHRCSFLDASDSACNVRLGNVQVWGGRAVFPTKCCGSWGLVIIEVKVKLVKRHSIVMITNFWSYSPFFWWYFTLTKTSKRQFILFQKFTTLTFSFIDNIHCLRNTLFLVLLIHFSLTKHNNMTRQLFISFFTIFTFQHAVSPRTSSNR